MVESRLCPAVAWEAWAAWTIKPILNRMTKARIYSGPFFLPVALITVLPHL
jgi:hypothetical protein